MRILNLGVGLLVLWAKTSFALSPESIISRLEGEYGGQETTQTAPRHVFAGKIEAPSFGKETLYFELRQGGPEGTIERQHLIVFKEDDSGVYSTTYTLLEGTKYARSDAIPARIAALTPHNSAVSQNICRTRWSEENGFVLSQTQDPDCPIATLKADSNSLIVEQQTLTRTANKNLDAQAAQIFHAFEGAFERHPESVSETSDSEKELRSLYTLARQVDVPAFGTQVMYMELRLGGLDGKVEMQRLISFEDAPGRPANIMRSYNFRPGNTYAGAHLNPSVLVDLKPDDLDPLPLGCEHIWHEQAGVLIGSVKQETCHIHIPSMDMWRYVSQEYMLDEESLYMWEQGFDPEGNLRFGTAIPLRYPRVKMSWTAND